MGEVLHSGDKVGIDGWVNTVAEVESLRISLASKELQLVSVDDPFNLLWEDRPPLPQSSPFILPLEYSGMSCSDKLTLVRESLCRNQADGILISALDEIAWTLNLRGNDVHCNPVLSAIYLLLKQMQPYTFYQKSLQQKSRHISHRIKFRQKTIQR